LRRGRKNESDRAGCHPIKAFILEKAVVHETHETVLAGNPQSGCSQKTRTNSNAYPDLLHHPLGALLNSCSRLFSFVNFVPFVDEMRF